MTVAGQDDLVTLLGSPNQLGQLRLGIGDGYLHSLYFRMIAAVPETRLTNGLSQLAVRNRALKLRDQAIAIEPDYQLALFARRVVLGMDPGPRLR